MDIQELVRAQRAYFLSSATRPYAFRMEQLKKLQRALQTNEKLLEQAMYQDFRKAPMEVYMCETGMVLEEVRFHLKHLKGWMRERAVPTPLAQFHAKSFVSPEPYGVALIISPWNYPVQLCLSPLVGAISGGNCAIVKPSAYAPATSAAIAKLIAETFDPRYIAAVEGGRAENSALLSQRFDTIFFTGSVAVGKVVMEAAAKNLTPVTLELGGKSPVIVDKTADVKLAARRIAFGKVLNAGQTCVEPDYLLIEKSVKPAFIEAYRQALHEFFPDGSMDEMPVIVSEKLRPRCWTAFRRTAPSCRRRSSGRSCPCWSSAGWTKPLISSAAGKSRWLCTCSHPIRPPSAACWTPAPSAAAASTTRSSILLLHTCLSAA